MLLPKRGVLIKNERLKMYKKPSTWILMGIIVLMTLLNLIFSKLIVSRYQTHEMTWQEQYGYNLEGYKAQLQQNPDDAYTKQLVEWTEYMLDNDIPPQDWRTDVVIEYINLKAQQLNINSDIPAKGDFDIYIPGIGYPGQNQPDLTEEQIEKRLEKLDEVLEKNDWKAYINLKIEDLKSGYTQSNNEQEKQVNIEIYEIYLKKNIIPTSQNMHYFFSGNLSSKLTWKSREIEEIRRNKLDLLRGEKEYGELLTRTMRKSIQQEIDISLKRLATDTPAIDPDSFLAQLESASTLIELFSILLIVYAGAIFASEYSTGTIKLLLITPHRRRKIFWAKMYLLLELTVIAVAANFIIAFLISGMFTAFEGIGAMQVFALFGYTFRIPYILYIVIKYMLLILPVLAYGSLAVMLSIVTRRSSVSTAVTLLLVFGSELIMTIIAAVRRLMIIPGIKFLLFANTNLASYLSARDMTNMVDTTMTLEFSIIVLLVYMACFIWIAHDSFCRRDVK